MSQVLLPSPVAIEHRPVERVTKKRKISPALSLFAGAVAGGVEAAATYPAEWAKTRSQLKHHAGQTRNPLMMTVQVARNEGIGAVYKGCSTLVVGTAFKAGVRFLTFDTVKTIFEDENGKLSPVRGMAAGSVAGCVESIFAVTPTERIKTALIDDARGQQRFKSGSQAFTTIIRESGIRELYRGLIATCVKQSATSAVRMGAYNVLKNAAADRQIKETSATTFASGAIAGVVTVYATQPFDTIKTRNQAAAGVTMSQAVRGILQDAGIRGLWSGSQARLARLIFSGGIVFTIYEQVVSIGTSGILAKHSY